MVDITRVDEELRSEIVEAQAAMARFVTEQKHCADTVALKGQRLLETDKGARARARTRPHTHTTHTPTEAKMMEVRRYPWLNAIIPYGCNPLASSSATT